jgi:hypothetical protein
VKKIIHHGEMIPPYYGLAYHDYSRDQAICYPLVINLIVILWLDTVRFFKHPKGRP